ncbi:hypothetical protein E4H12_08130 [Candidatus Thorarchaeota archaeon]|nr:MAG: hypothetical protein E4H12_08130 [Candidatus Thorarchaeota archaeon]
MRKVDWQIISSVIFSGLLFLIAGLLFAAIGRDTWFLGITMVFAPLIALSFGASGLRIYAKDTVNKDDRFNTMNLWLAIGLIMLSFAEIAVTLVRLSLNPPQMALIIALVHLPGLLLWGIGIIQYLRSLNSSLGFIDANKLWMGLFLFATLTTLSLIVITVIQFPVIGPIEIMVLSPIIVGISVFTIITTGLVWIFRNGSLVKPLFFILGALLLYFVRSLLWLFADTTLGSPIDGLFAIESFILCGTALFMARNLGNIHT